ncbi:DUF4365 domain-containing protein [Leptospira kanakyensis]|uniref:DUF4365 domain-containing protein n=1 Tax=Leptospira kanakyensis TaxID=2484968 RepID=A0A6N4Q4A7_9LEPT|nr:DUF4365 domain-containing protein [Leptospira kanakyensis]MCW7471679.1 DUF4365 domain-containing protein [Leptospira kanakyensis]MCW7483268.1 DUF4365 domain-containing protein [Leptospira kanakyensis]TGK65310.1 DUF4365 domain-containing protein [Leptospira kanakyensis]
MHITQKKEQFSIGFMKSICAVMGYNTSTMDVDDESVDMQISAKGFSGIIRNPIIQVQLKCTIKTVEDDGFIHFPLKLKNYDDLRGDNLSCPRYLIVITIPESESNWLRIHHKKMTFRYSAYYFSLKDCEEVKNEHNITLKIPKTNLLTFKSLSNLIDNASAGIAL